MFEGDAGTGAGESASTTDANQTADGARDEFAGIDGLGDKGKAAIRAERDARKAAEDTLKAIKQQLSDLQKKETDRETAEQARRDAEAAEAGKWEEIAAKRGSDLDAAKADVSRLTGEVDQLRAAMAAGIATGWKDLPEAVRKIGEKQHPEDDVLGRFQFLHDPDTAALVKQLADREPTARGNGRDPRSGGERNTVDQEVAALRARGGYAM